jgi:hypothetical protein
MNGVADEGLKRFTLERDQAGDHETWNILKLLIVRWFLGFWGVRTAGRAGRSRLA